MHPATIFFEKKILMFFKSFQRNLSCYISDTDSKD